MILGIIVHEFLVGSPFSPFPKYLTTKPDSPVSPWGAAVNALRLQLDAFLDQKTLTFGIPFGIDVFISSKMAKV